MGSFGDRWTEDANGRLTPAGGEAVSIDQLSNGVAGSGNTIQGLWGTTGEEVPLYSIAKINDSFSTSSTSYTTVTPSGNYPVPQDSIVDAFTNMDTYKISLQAQLNNSGGGNALLRIAGESGTEISGDGFTSTHGPKVEITVTSATSYNLEMKSSDGNSSSAFSPAIIVWGVIG